jgi:sigma-E factor negative regulatory protein RseC
MKEMATMTALPVIQPDTLHSVEGIARVVRIDGDRVWLEPEQTTSCGHCASSASCGTREAPGMGTVSTRLQARRFQLDNPEGLNFNEGDRLVVAVSERSLIKAALTAYGLPLLFALVTASLVQAAYGRDETTLLGMLGGLALGLLVARINAGRLAARGELAPHFVRRARPDETCASV